jgi:hypothetical protein
VSVSEFSSREAVAWRNEHAKKSLKLIYDLLAKRIDELLDDAYSKTEILHILRDLQRTTDKAVDQNQ